MTTGSDHPRGGPSSITLCPASQCHQNPSEPPSQQSPASHLLPLSLMWVHAGVIQAPQVPFLLPLACWPEHQPHAPLSLPGRARSVPPSEVHCLGHPGPGASLLMPGTCLGPGSQQSTVSSGRPLPRRPFQLSPGFCWGSKPKKFPHLRRRAWNMETTSSGPTRSLRSHLLGPGCHLRPASPYGSCTCTSARYGLVPAG